MNKLINIDATQICEMIKKAGVVGAGGAGFPTHVKLSCNAEVVIANGAECEPILETDRQLLLREPQKVIDGLLLAMKATGANKGIIALKEKHHDIISVIEPLIIKEKNIQLFKLENFYPAGDEQVLTYEVTCKVVPMGGIPIHVGAVVQNVFTLAMIADSVKEKSFTHRYVTVTGEVNRPAVAYLPIGMPISQAIELVGLGAKTKDTTIVLGGPMMGKIETDLSLPITKTTGGIIVLPKDHPVVNAKTMSLEVSTKRAKSVCCQCNFCTELCPRYLLGHRIFPHKMMRTVSSMGTDMNEDVKLSAALCCDCGLCSSFACTMGLAPNRVNSFLKATMARNNVRADFKSHTIDPVNNFRDFRKLNTNRLINKLGLADYTKYLEFIELKTAVDSVSIPLKQHIGAPAVSIVNVGQRVAFGEMIGKIDDDKLGANIHATISGMVTFVNDSIVIQNQ